MIKKVLITGASGFIGSHLTEQCIQWGYSVKAFDQYNRDNSWGWLEDSIYRNDIEVVLGDIRDYSSVYDAMKGCDTVFHLAALIGIPYSYVSPLAYVRTNIEGTYNILEAARQQGLKNVLVSSTSEAYGTAQYVPIDERHPTLGQSPYSASKIGADQLAISYFLSFGLPVKIVRPFNAYGPRQSARAVIPSIICQVLNGSNEIKVGNLTPTRDFTYVLDTTSGFLHIGKSEELVGEVVNIGMNEKSSIGDLVQTIGKLMGTEIRVQRDEKRVRPEASEVQRLVCDNSKLLRHTSWTPQYTLESGLMETIKWLEANLHLYKLDQYNI